MRVRLLDDKEHTEPFPKNLPNINGFFPLVVHGWNLLFHGLDAMN